MNWKKAYNKFETIFLNLWFIGTALFLTVVGMALVGKFVTVEIFNINQLTGLVIILIVATLWLPFWSKVMAENKKKKALV